MEDQSSTAAGDKKEATGDRHPPPPETEKRRAGGWKVCRGCTYYSSRLRSDGQPPRCIGQQVNYPVSGSTENKYQLVAGRDRNLSYFKYGCVGYTIFSQDKDPPAENQQNPKRLPICVVGGYELLVGRRRIQSGGKAQGPLLKENEFFVRYQSIKESNRSYFDRFTRSSILVGSAVPRDILRMGSYVKDAFDNILYPDRRRPK